MSDSDLERERSATAKQRSKFEESGDLPRSPHLITAVVFASLMVFLSYTGPQIAHQIVNLMRQTYGHIEQRNFYVWRQTVFTFWETMGAFFFLNICLAIGFHTLQNRGRFVWKTPEIDFTKFLNPFPRLIGIFSIKIGFKDLCLVFARVGVFIAGCYVILKEHFFILTNPTPTDIVAGLMLGRGLFRTLLIRAVGIMIVLGLIEYVMNYFSIEKKMKMSDQQVRDEAKDQGSNSSIKGKRKKKHRDLILQRSLKYVKKADVVLVNPTHYAVAIAYKEDSMHAPKVVGKGADAWAEKLRAIARKHGIPIVAQPALTRLIYKKVAVNKYIPEELYQAVAVVLAYVFKKRKTMV